MIKNQQTFNIKLRKGSTDIIVFPVPSLEAVKKVNTSIYLDDNTKRRMQEDAQKETARPYVVAHVGDGVNSDLEKGSEYLKAGDLVFCNPDSMSACTVIRFSTTVFWKNPVIMPSFYAYKVENPEEYEKEFDEVIDWYNAEQVKKEAILEKTATESAKIKLLVDTDIDKVVAGFEYRMYDVTTEKWELFVVSEKDAVKPSFKVKMESNINSRRVAFK